MSQKSHLPRAEESFEKKLETQIQMGQGRQDKKWSLRGKILMADKVKLYESVRQKNSKELCT